MVKIKNISRSYYGWLSAAKCRQQLMKPIKQPLHALGNGTF